ncbi:MAG: hypothetical protein WCJ51_00080 [Candidatus Moraniibacteriota bacterium]
MKMISVVGVALIDTGDSGDLKVNEELASKLSLKHLTTEVLIGGYFTNQKKVKYREIIYNSGGVVFTGHVIIGDASSKFAIIGLHYLRNAGVESINCLAGEVTFEKPATAKSTCTIATN